MTVRGIMYYFISAAREKNGVLIGEHTVEFEQKGNAGAQYGKALIAKLSGAFTRRSTSRKVCK